MSMMIVGSISSPQEAKEIEFITKSFVVGRRARHIAHKLD
jgi:hypothetical protein